MKLMYEVCLFGWLTSYPESKTMKLRNYLVPMPFCSDRFWRRLRAGQKFLSVLFVSSANSSTFTVSTVSMEVPFNNEEARDAQLKYFEEKQPFVHEQPPKSTQFIPSLFEMNTSEVTWAQQQEDEWNQAGIDGEESLRRKQDNLSKLIVEAFQGANSGDSKSLEDDLDDILRGGGDDATLRTGFGRRKDFEVEQTHAVKVTYENGDSRPVDKEGKEEEDLADAATEEAAREEEIHSLNARIRDLANAITNLTNETELAKCNTSTDCR
eukprot:TRINITY_DN1663_c0_g1_i1.p1 TRINITY_DN1663_c0_g1~~TRINITY_DN1663_c0_g1_i1.p1  ORF type:complete len:267 (+),score=41.49 TRINITY_DN1663_c0_g1_i1:385-1185(+)